MCVCFSTCLSFYAEQIEDMHILYLFVHFTITCVCVVRVWFLLYQFVCQYFACCLFCVCFHVHIHLFQYSCVSICLLIYLALLTCILFCCIRISLSIFMYMCTSKFIQTEHLHDSISTIMWIFLSFHKHLFSIFIYIMATSLFLCICIPITICMYLPISWCITPLVYKYVCIFTQLFKTSIHTYIPYQYTHHTTMMFICCYMYLFFPIHIQVYLKVHTHPFS